MMILDLLNFDLLDSTDLDSRGKFMRVLSGIGKMVALLALLFLFVCSLDLLSSAFRLVGGRTTGAVETIFIQFTRPPDVT